MSKHNVTIILLLVSFNSFLACDVADNNVENDQIEYLHASTSETYISISEARENVDSFLHEFDALTKATNHRYIINQFSRGGFDSTKAEQEKEPLVYVFNFNDNQGYAIASGDSRMPAILCVTENGNLLENDILDNPGEIAMLSIIDTDYRMAVGLPIENYEGLWISPEEYGYSSPLVTKAQGAYHDTSEWVIDQHLVRRQYRYTFDGNNNLIDTEEIRQQLLHCCWGWMNGQSNGYYFAGNFDTNHGLVTRSDQDYYYQYKLDIHTNIHP